MKRDLFSMMLYLLVGVIVPAASSASQPEEVPVRTSLVAQQVGEGSAAQLWAGVHFRMEPGWHVYWRNPGEAGLSTLVELELGQGPEFGEVRWPAPLRFEQPGGIIGYGYEDEVVLAAPSMGPVSAAATLSATASWLACKARCIQGSARLEATVEQALETGAEPKLWRDFRASLPRLAPPDELRVHTTSGVETGARTLWLSWAESPQTAELFPAPSERLELAPSRLRSRGPSSRADLKMALVAGAKEWPHELQAVVVAAFADGRREAYEIAIPLH